MHSFRGYLKLWSIRVPERGVCLPKVAKSVFAQLGLGVWSLGLPCIPIGRAGSFLIRWVQGIHWAISGVRKRMKKSVGAALRWAPVDSSPNCLRAADKHRHRGAPPDECRATWLQEASHITLCQLSAYLRLVARKGHSSSCYCPYSNWTKVLARFPVNKCDSQGMCSIY